MTKAQKETKTVETATVEANNMGTPVMNKKGDVVAYLQEDGSMLDKQGRKCDKDGDSAIKYFSMAINLLEKVTALNPEYKDTVSKVLTEITPIRDSLKVTKRKPASLEDLKANYEKKEKAFKKLDAIKNRNAKEEARFVLAKIALEEASAFLASV